MKDRAALQLRSDRSLCPDIALWSQYAHHLVKTIGGLRDASPNRREEATRELLADEPDLFEHFAGLSRIVSAAAAMHHPAEPCNLILDIASHVERFFRFGLTDGIPSQAELVIAYNRVGGMLNVLACSTAERIRRAEAKMPKLSARDALIVKLGRAVTPHKAIEAQVAKQFPNEAVGESRIRIILENNGVPGRYRKRDAKRTKRSAI